MANTTDIMITTFFDDDAIEYIKKETGLDFKKVTDENLSGGTHVLSFDAFGLCLRCLPENEIKNLIEVFKKAPFDAPQYVSMIIDDDDSETFNGIWLLNLEEK